MTRERFKRANEVHSQIEHLIELNRLLDNAKGNYLSAMKLNGTWTNRERVDREILNEFKNIFQARIDNLEKEFGRI